MSFRLAQQPKGAHLPKVSFRDSNSLGAMSYPEIEAMAAGAIALLPIGACEAHGPHLPVNTDVIIATAGAEATARWLAEREVKALVLPPVSYGVTDFAAGFAGTIGVSAATTNAYVSDIVRSALRSGFAAVVLCNAHLDPAHVGALRQAVEGLAADGLAVSFPDVTRRKNAALLGEEFQSGACHAGRYETSLVLAAAPDLVDRDAAAGLSDNPNSLIDAMRAGHSTFEQAGGPEAYFGFPRLASAAEGRTLFTAMAGIFGRAALAMVRTPRP